MDKEHQKERVVWQACPSWRQFGWLYFFALWTGLRGMLLLKMGVPGWELWVGGLFMLVGLSVILRYWATYLVTGSRIALINGYSGRELESIEIENIKKVVLHIGPLAVLLGIGTVIIEERDTDRKIRFRGVRDPEVVAAKIKALLPAS